MVLVGIVGPRSSGKTSVAGYLKTNHGFQELSINSSMDSLMFETFAEAIAYATSNWRERLLIQNIDRYSDYEMACKRPFFLLLWVDAPLRIRYKRTVRFRDEERTLSELSLHDTNEKIDGDPSFIDFVCEDELILYSVYGKRTIGNGLNMATNLYNFIDKTNLKLFNDSDSLCHLYSQIDGLNLLNDELLRPTWDSYFMALCELASKRSNCMKRRVGCIIVSESRVISTGYNGTPKGITNCNEGGCGRCNGNASCGSSLDQCICMHAEENALLEAGRERISHRKVTLYCNTCPCLGCAKKIIQVGISEVVYAQDYGMDSLTISMFQQAGVLMRQIKHTKVSLC